MAKSRKKTVGQQVVGVATLGMPSPVKKVASSRWGSRIFLLLALGLFGAGIVTVQWTNGRPQLKINKERAQEVKRNIAHEIETVRGTDHGHQFHPFAAQQSAEPGVIRQAIENIQPNADEGPHFPQLGSSPESSGPLRDLSAKLLPRPAPENQPPARPTKMPWMR